MSLYENIAPEVARTEATYLEVQRLTNYLRDSYQVFRDNRRRSDTFSLQTVVLPNVKLPNKTYRDLFEIVKRVSESLVDQDLPVASIECSITHYAVCVEFALPAQ